MCFYLDDTKVGADRGPDSIRYASTANSSWLSSDLNPGPACKNWALTNNTLLLHYVH